MTNLDFDSWLASTAERREDLMKYSVSPLPKDLTQRHQDIDECIQAESDACGLLADAESFFSLARAQATLEIQHKYPELAAKERDIMLEAEIRDIKRLVAGLKIVAQSLKSRRFSSMNAGRWHD